MPKLASIDASFLAGEVDPAVIAQVDDAVRSNGANRIRNGYVRSMGGMHTRPGMRVVQAIPGADFNQARDLSNLRLFARTAGIEVTEPDPVAVTLPPVAILPPWPQAAADLFRIEFGRTLPRGTTIRVRMRLSLNAPDGYVENLWWWERHPGASGQTISGVDVGKWRSGSGHDPMRGARPDRLFINNRAWETFTHVLQDASDAISLRSWAWQGAAGGQPVRLQRTAGNYALEVLSWSGAIPSRPGAGDRPAARLLDVTWFPGTELLLALHAPGGSLLLTHDDLSFSLNPQGFAITRSVGDDEVRTMQATRTPLGTYLFSPLEPFWPPRILAVERAGGFNLRIQDAQISVSGRSATRQGQSETLFGPGDSGRAPAVLYGWQGRLIMAGSERGPNAIVFSRAGDRSNFNRVTPTQQRPLLADDSFMVEEAGRPLNRFVAIHGGLLLVFFGTHGISFLDRGFISATDFGFRENSERGIKVGVPPVEIGTGRLCFVESHGQSVWLMTYANERQGYVLSELSQVAPHLLAVPEDMVFYSGLADGGTAVLVVNRNGTIACCAIQPEGEWHAWSQWSSGEPDENGFTDILDVETHRGLVWAMTRRGQLGKSVYIERFDDTLELDFCQRTEADPDAAWGTHEFAAFYERWSAVAEMRDGSRVRFGMLPPGGNLAEPPQTFTPTQIFAGLSTFPADQFRPDGGEAFEPADVVAWQVGQPFTWELETMPFVKRTAEGSAFTSPTKTQECFVQCVERVDEHYAIPADAEDALVRAAGYTVNGEYRRPVPRLFAEPRPKRIGARHVAYQHRFVNLIGWRSQNTIALKGQRPCIIASISRTVVT